MALQLQQSMATMNHQIRQLNQQHQFANPQPTWNQHTNVDNPGPHLFQQQNQYLNPQPTWTQHTNFNNPGPYSFQQHPNIHLFPQPPAYQFTRPPPNIQHTRQLFPPHYNAMHHPLRLTYLTTQILKEMIIVAMQLHQRKLLIQTTTGKSIKYRKIYQMIRTIKKNLFKNN
ncbi:Hypothetical predicted protein [Mytilus galloprovincialis]|uniref:Uncharacterized protein n=1 Tax=Mytilus galloprovincialis TaxID=29158 RepID=A0A8B6EIJ1_MYTGA|nr:Hypothetical predicted protein [Mytilus galloprovincialis]